MKLLFALITFFACASAFATDGNRLIAVCSVVDKSEFNPQEFNDMLACTNYIDGVLDANTFWESRADLSRKTKDSVCAPSDAGINTLQGARIVLKYLRANPDKLHWNAAVLVMNAMHEAFPCK